MHTNFVWIDTRFSSFVFFAKALLRLIKYKEINFWVSFELVLWISINSCFLDDTGAFIKIVHSLMWKKTSDVEALKFQEPLEDYDDQYSGIIYTV